MGFYLVLFFLGFIAFPHLAHSYEGTVVADAPTEIEYLSLHMHPTTAQRPLLSDLIHSFERPSLSPPIQWLILVSGIEAEKEITDLLKSRHVRDPQEKIQFIYSPEAYDTWSRDLYFASYQSADQYSLKPFYPDMTKKGEASVEHLVQAVSKFRYESQPKEFVFAGGDITSDDAFVYLGELSIQEMVKRGVAATRKEAGKIIEARFEKELIVLPGKDEHQDRYHLPLGVLKGQRVSLLADPAKALDYLLAMNKEEKEEMIASYANEYTWEQPETVTEMMNDFFQNLEIKIDQYKASDYVRALDEAQEALEQKGVRVIRIPTLNRKFIDDEPLPFGLYYVNAVQDAYRALNGEYRRKIVMPSYGLERLENTIAQELKMLGIDEIRFVRALREGFRGAGIRCLLQVFGVKIDPQQQGASA